MLGSPSANRRLTRGSTRRQRAGETDEQSGSELGPPELVPSSQSKGETSASDIEAESDSEHRSMPELAGSSDVTDSESAAEESGAEGISIRPEPEDEASRKLGWSLAAQEAGVFACAGWFY